VFKKNGRGIELSKWTEEKKAVLETSRRMEEKGLVVGTSGNVSLRLTPENGRELLAITPTSRYYDLLTPDDIQVIDFEAEPVEGELPPSVETMMHIGIYRTRRNVQSVIHTHSVYACALAIAHMEIPAILEDQMTVIGGEIKLAPYAPSGSDEQVRNVIEALEDRNAALIMNHGVVGLGRDLREAFTVCELIEKTAKAYYFSLTLGKVNPLPVEGIESGKVFFRMLHHGK
jgi:L-fuculose-phosphate aldolase